MPEFLVRFERPVIYLSGHPEQAPIDQLRVQAEDGQKAITHALRVTSGEPGAVSAEHYAGA